MTNRSCDHRMVQYHVLTYATHSGGTYECLIHDGRMHGIEIKTLGWGTKWTGFCDKLRAMRDEIQSYDARDVVVFIDGFDSRLHDSLNTLKYKFATHFPDAFAGNSVLFSKDVSYDLPIVPHCVQKYMTYRILGGEINSGMYMGRVRKLRQLLDRALRLEDHCKGDDQRAFNRLKSHIVTDDRQLIFKNLSCEERKMPQTQSGSSVFTSCPGSLTMDRVHRAVYDYAPFFDKEIVGVVVLIVAVCLAVDTVGTTT